MKNTTKIFDIIRKEIDNKKARSAWERGVKVYALELVDEVEERSEYEKRIPEPGAELLEFALNGADSWPRYSWSGCSLAYDCDIAERLCTPSDLKKTRNGERRPNSREEWLDVQARALYQAYVMVKNIYRRVYSEA